VEFGARVRFRHPLARSAAYQSASLLERRETHHALALATDPQADPDRRAWHLAPGTWHLATSGPDEKVAAEVEHSAGRAQARGGMAAAAAFCERSALLTADPVRRAERTLAAAQANLQAGAFDNALGLLATAEAGPLADFASARVDLLRAHVAFASGLGNNARPLLLKAARRLEPFSLELARETYLDAWGAAIFAGTLVGAGDLLEISRAARALPRPTSPPGPAGLLLDGLALLITDGRVAAAPALRQAVRFFASAQISTADVLRWGWMTQAATTALWDDDGWRAILTRHLAIVRAAGALDRLPIYLAAMGTAAAWSSDFAAAASVAAEADAVSEATGTRIAPFGAMLLAALRGDQTQTASLIAATTDEAGAGGQGIAVAYAQWAAAILANGLGHYNDARRGPAGDRGHPGPVRLDVGAAGADRGRRAHRQRVAGRRWAEAGEAAEGGYQEAIDRLGRTQLRPELARRTWFTANGCAGRAGASMPGRSCGPPTPCCPRWAPRPLPDAPGVSCWPPVRRYANARSRPLAPLLRRRCPSSGSSRTAAPTPR
jgi:hypothetical protein